MIKMPISERAKQFGSFSALRGYEKLIEEKKFILSPKKELTEEMAENLSRKVSKLKKGDIVKITYYKKDGYIEKEGIITRIDLTMKNITVVKEYIEFEDIYDIETLGEL